MCITRDTLPNERHITCLKRLRHVASEAIEIYLVVPSDILLSEEIRYYFEAKNRFQ